MDTRLLEDALVLLEEGSLSAAAARRNMTQPAFSRRIRALEDWIGCELLTRGANRVSLSPTLGASEMQIRAMLAELRQLRGILGNRAAATQTLVIATQHSLALSVVPEICQSLGALKPNLVTRLRTLNQDGAASIFLRREADVLIAYEQRGQARMPFDDSIARCLWRRDVLVPIAAGSLRAALTGDGALPAGYPVIRYPDDSFIGQMIAAHEAGCPETLDGPKIVESAFSMGVARLVRAGVGASWAPHSIVHGDVISGDVVILSSAYGRIPMDIVLFAHRLNATAVDMIKAVATAGAGDPPARG